MAAIVAPASATCPTVTAVTHAVRSWQTVSYYMWTSCSCWLLLPCLISEQPMSRAATLSRPSAKALDMCIATQGHNTGTCFLSMHMLSTWSHVAALFDPFKFEQLSCLSSHTAAFSYTSHHFQFLWSCMSCLRLRFPRAAIPVHHIPSTNACGTHSFR